MAENYNMQGSYTFSAGQVILSAWGTAVNLNLDDKVSYTKTGTQNIASALTVAGALSGASLSTGSASFSSGATFNSSSIHIGKAYGLFRWTTSANGIAEFTDNIIDQIITYKTPSAPDGTRKTTNFSFDLKDDGSGGTTAYLYHCIDDSAAGVGGSVTGWTPCTGPMQHSPQETKTYTCGHTSKSPNNDGDAWRFRMKFYNVNPLFTNYSHGLMWDGDEVS